MSKRPKKFTGVPFTPKEKCYNCEYLERCRNGDNSFTAKEIVIDCEGFYYIFKKLESFERHPVFDGNEEKYKKQILAYEADHEGMPFLTPPLIANGALAAELALKFLIFKENGEFDCIHDLQQLFESLPDCHKIPLTEIICQQAHQNEETLQDNLSNIKNLFEDMRYFFSHESVGYSGFFNEFVHIVCEYAISQKPPDEDTQ